MYLDQAKTRNLVAATLRKGPMRPHNTALNLTVTTLACARVAPAG